MTLTPKAFLRYGVLVLVVVFRTLFPMEGHWKDGRAAFFVREAYASLPEAPCDEERLDLGAQLERVFAGQQRTGNIVFEGRDSVLSDHPIMATLALEAYRASRNLVFLQKAHGAVKGYLNYLLVNRDTDKDFLVERPASRNPGSPSDIEDPGFNAMLALDMLSLSQICVELSMPMDALFWYRGARTLSNQILKSTFDPTGPYFFATRATDPQRESLTYGLSALPVCFPSRLGREISLAVIRNYVLTDRAFAPESPSHYLTWEFSAGERSASSMDARILRSMLLLGALEANGLDGVARQMAAGLPGKIAQEAGTVEAGPALSEATRFASCVISSPGPYSPFPRYEALSVFDRLVFQKALLDPERMGAFRRSVEDVRRFLVAHSDEPDSAAAVNGTFGEFENASNAIREVYFAVSSIKERWKQRALFSKSDRSEGSGFDAYAAVSDLCDEVVETLQNAENIIATRQFAGEGIDFTRTVETTSLGPGEAAPIRIALSARNRAVGLRSIVIFREQAIDTLVSAPSPLLLSPGQTGREYRYMYPTPHGRVSTIVPVQCSIEVRLDGGKRIRYHIRTAVFVTRPVTFAVRFPKGTTLENGAVPVEVLIDKHLSVGATIQTQWYSPAGLRPVEGRTLEAWMPEQTKQAVIPMNVLVPNPCRPGAFPFTLKVFANGEEAGTVSSELFKHYQWLFVGPFPARHGGLDTRYPPESQVNLFDTYTGALGQLAWQTLPPSAYIDDGRVSLASLLPKNSVGFLYTVIECAAPRVSSVRLESSNPALIFVNGNPLGSVAGDPSRAQRFEARLKGGMNNLLVKVMSRDDPVVFLQLGDEEDLMADEFNNNLWELVDGYQELLTRGRGTEAKQVRRQVTITYHDPRAASVSVVGSFNGWSPAKSTMRKNKYGDWEVSLYLSPGRYTYRLRVDDTTEVVDPSSPYSEPDGYGGQNSVLYVQ